MGNLDRVPGSCILPGPAPVLAVIWTADEDLSVSPSICNSAFQINESFFFFKGKSQMPLKSTTFSASQADSMMLKMVWILEHCALETLGLGRLHRRLKDFKDELFLQEHAFPRGSALGCSAGQQGRLLQPATYEWIYMFVEAPPNSPSWNILSAHSQEPSSH